jgi:hypothetical protein
MPVTPPPGHPSILDINSGHPPPILDTHRLWTPTGIDSPFPTDPGHPSIAGPEHRARAFGLHDPNPWTPTNFWTTNFWTATDSWACRVDGCPRRVRLGSDRGRAAMWTSLWTSTNPQVRAQSLDTHPAAPSPDGFAGDGNSRVSKGGVPGVAERGAGAGQVTVKERAGWLSRTGLSAGRPRSEVVGCPGIGGWSRAQKTLIFTKRYSGQDDLRGRTYP